MIGQIILRPMDVCYKVIMHFSLSTRYCHLANLFNLKKKNIYNRGIQIPSNILLIFLGMYSLPIPQTPGIPYTPSNYKEESLGGGLKIGVKGLESRILYGYHEALRTIKPTPKVLSSCRSILPHGIDSHLFEYVLTCEIVLQYFPLLNFFFQL